MPRSVLLSLAVLPQMDPAFGRVLLDADERMRFSLMTRFPKSVTPLAA